MTSLNAEPAGRVRSIGEFFALARAMELDAATRYTETSRQLRAQGETALARVFEELAETELSHIRQVDQWEDHEGAGATADLPWSIPDTFDASPDEMAGSKLLTPYQALASAVRHEQRSFAFWTYVAAHAETDDVKDAAERMALEELEHVRLLRRERRKAFHEGRREGRPAGEEPVTLAGLAALERRLAELIESDSASAHGAEMRLFLAGAARESSAKLEDLHATEPTEFSGPALPVERSGDVSACAEYLAESYLRLAETTQNAHVLGVVQELAKVAIYRLGTLRAEEHGDLA